MYRNLGRDVTLKRKDMAAHEQNDSLHLHMAIKTINLLKGSLNNGQPLLTDYQRRRASNEIAISKPYYINPRGYSRVLTGISQWKWWWLVCQFLIK